MTKKSSVEVADAITNLVFLTIWRLILQWKLFFCIFPLLCSVFKYAVSQRLGLFYWWKKVAFFSYTAICLLAFLTCCSHGFLLFLWQAKDPTMYCISLCTLHQQHSSNHVVSAAAGSADRTNINHAQEKSIGHSQPGVETPLLSLMW